MTFSLSLFIKVFLIFQTLSSDVVGVMDGDTIELRMVSSDPRSKTRVGKNLRIRLAHVDCPERGMPFYQNAKRFTSEKCYRKTVKIVHNNEYDRYGRLVGEVILPNGTNLNQELVKAGMALHYKKYSSSWGYAQLEIQARVKKVGIWGI
ncbi:nuclease [Lacihabitans sp. CCS-44]|uniref:thermonuclease family protein n=1 Tax=Lacihabitans sp. CCS-44 TaxID=2487331 RepID=UPI0020CE744B|nr:thermonuclease family protein [Lacihabitans sp. CCS-44]MCP9755288.1 nuclease [Lacihabitans sp. CCS-44]